MIHHKSNTITAIVHQGRYLREAPTGWLTSAFCFSCGHFTALGKCSFRCTPYTSSVLVILIQREPQTTSELIRRANCFLLPLIAASKSVSLPKEEIQKYLSWVAACEMICLLPRHEACKRLASGIAVGVRHNRRSRKIA